MLAIDLFLSTYHKRLKEIILVELDISYQARMKSRVLFLIKKARIIFQKIISVRLLRESKNIMLYQDIRKLRDGPSLRSWHWSSRASRAAYEVAENRSHSESQLKDIWYYNSFIKFTSLILNWLNIRFAFMNLHTVLTRFNEFFIQAWFDSMNLHDTRVLNHSFYIWLFNFALSSYFFVIWLVVWQSKICIIVRIIRVSVNIIVHISNLLLWLFDFDDCRYQMRTSSDASRFVKSTMIKIARVADSIIWSILNFVHFVHLVRRIAFSSTQNFDQRILINHRCVSRVSLCLVANAYTHL